MLGSALVASLLASAVVAWGLPVPLSPPPPHIGSIFGPDTALAPGAKVDGSVDKEIIRRIIRRHINEAKWCYEQELAKKPDLAGRIMVQFTIAASGQVIASVLQNSTMQNDRVESCTVEAVRRWQFPKPIGGGIVIVSYPFVFTPTAATKTAATQIVVGTYGAGAVEIEAFDATRFVHRSTDAHAVPSNGLVAVTERGLLLVDTAWTEAQTEAVLHLGRRAVSPALDRRGDHARSRRPRGRHSGARAPAHPGLGARPDRRQADPARRARRDDAVPRA